MSHATTGARAGTPPLPRAVSCRIDFRAVTAGACSVHTGRLECLSATGCSIQTSQRPTSGDALELWIYLPGLTSVLRINHAKVTWACSDALSVEFVHLAVAEQLRLGDYLSDEDFIVDAVVNSAPIHPD